MIWNGSFVSFAKTCVDVCDDEEEQTWTCTWSSKRMLLRVGIAELVEGETSTRLPHGPLPSVQQQVTRGLKSSTRVRVPGSLH